MRRFKPILFIAVLYTFIFSSALAERVNFISPDQVDLVKILAPPPAKDSPQTKAEIQELIGIQCRRSSKEAAAAEADANLTIFQFAGNILGPKFTPENLPITGKFFEQLCQEGEVIVKHAKDTWKKPRPFMLSQKIKPCVPKPDSWAYPSGHTTFGYLSGIVLANMIPEKKEALFARAAQYGFHRMVGGVHCRSDVEAGRIAGTVIAAIMMQNPHFQEEYSKVKNEIRKFMKLQ